MKFNKILIVRLSAIGDVINTLPALQVLRTNFPKSFIAWVVEDRSRDLLIDHPQLDKVFVFERKKWRPGIRSLKSWRRFSRTLKEVRSFVRQIKNEKFDLALDFQGNFKSGLTTYLSGARERVGFDKQTSKEANHLFLTQKIKLPTEPLNRVARNLHLLKSLGLNTREPTPVVFLPATGQTECWDGSGASIACAGTGQDGEYQKGVLAAPRFMDNGDGTVTDTVTGLIWLKNANCFGYTNWSSALSTVAGLANGACDLADGSSAGEWRLPNINELQSVIDFGQYNRALPLGHPFYGMVPTGKYWTSTTNNNYHESAWSVYHDTGEIRSTGKTGSGLLYIWPVKNGP